AWNWRAPMASALSFWSAMSLITVASGSGRFRREKSHCLVPLIRRVSLPLSCAPVPHPSFEVPSARVERPAVVLDQSRKEQGGQWPPLSSLNPQMDLASEWCRRVPERWTEASLG